MPPKIMSLEGAGRIVAVLLNRLLLYKRRAVAVELSSLIDNRAPQG
ncbi:MAG: hypothetical protein WBQ44_23355 [Rhodococcus sp. (in: high G+C Gram-positive bacteria)]